MNVRKFSWRACGFVGGVVVMLPRAQVDFTSSMITEVIRLTYMYERISAAVER